jgi:hypothetical protein
MAVIIKYNGSDPFKTNGIPTPLVGRDSEHVVFGSKRCVKDVITLTGQVPGCDHSTLVTRRSAILNAFSSNYKTLSIEDDSVEILSKEFCKINNISFDNSRYVGVLEYAITIECYDEDLHNEFYGITQPVNEVKISLNEDKTYSIERNISAVGFNLQDNVLSGGNTTSKSSSLQNAIDFVESMSGVENVILPSNSPDLKIYLSSKSEKINRIKGSYSITESYIGDSLDVNANRGVLRYVTNISSEFSSNKSVSIKGNLIFGLDSSFSLVRDRFAELNFHEIAESECAEKLVKFPLSVSISENISSSSIDFNFSFDNDFDYNECGVSNKRNYSIDLSGEIITVNVSGEVSARGPVEKRWEMVQDEFYNNIKPNLYQSANAELQSIHPTRTPTHTPTVCGDGSYGLELSQEPLAKKIDEDRQSGIISYDYSFSNLSKEIGFSEWNYSVNVNMPVPNYSIDMNAGSGMDKYIISRTGNSKGSASVRVSGDYTEYKTKQEAEASINNKKDEILEEIKCSFIEKVANKSQIPWVEKISSGSTEHSNVSNFISRSVSVEYYEMEM